MEAQPETAGTEQLQGADAVFVRELLTEACAQVTQELGLTAEQKDNLLERCEGVVNILACSEDGVTGDAPPPETAQPACSHDADVAQLLEQVSEAVQRVQALKESAPRVLAESAQKQLLSQRPQSKGVMAAQQLSAMLGDVSGLTAGPTPSSAAQAEYARLRQELTGLMDQLPGIRLQLQHSEQRLSANMQAVESERSRASPRTVERVLKDCGVGGGGGFGRAGGRQQRQMVQHSPPVMARLGSGQLSDKMA